MNAESVKARLKNFAKNTGHTFQETLIYYGLERTIYRISVSEYAEHFVLKGGIFLYALFDRSFERATTDVDLLARRISNRSEEMKTVFQRILSQEIDDALVFDIDSITVAQKKCFLFRFCFHKLLPWPTEHCPGDVKISVSYAGEFKI